MGADTSLDGAREEWIRCAPQAFLFLKEIYGLGDAWSFPIERIDQAPADSDPNDLQDEAGAAAFMLRRMQAIWFLLESDMSEHSRGLCLGYASDLAAYLIAITRDSVNSNGALAEVRAATVQLVAELSMGL